MKAFLILVVLVLLAVIIVFFFLGQASQSGKAAGVVNGRLTKCPSKPNCVSSEYGDDVEHYIEPITLNKMNADNLSVLKSVIQSMGGKLEHETASYIAATFTSGFFKFVDDLEIRIDPDNKLIHIRSSSRVGYSDAGVNEKRVQLLKEHYQARSVL